MRNSTTNLNNKMSKRIAYKTIGCKLNFAETSTIVRDFKRNGFKIVDFGAEADVYLINTCTVTANADKDCRKSARQAIRSNPKAFVAMVGCYSQLQRKEAQTIPGVTTILGNDEKYNLFKYYTDFTKDNKIDYHENIDHLESFHSSYSTSERTRAFLKIQDGCDYECSYCTIPMARGKSRSGSIANTIDRAKEVAATGTKEIVLTGVNTGDFGNGTDESFFELIKKLDKLEGIERIRISSIEPNLLTNEMTDFIAQSKLFVPHFHIPLQSGSNKILADMRRRYQRELYSERVDYIKSVMPDSCIGVDVIVGFPTETEKLFNETFEFIRNLDISYLHVFSYSQRENTKATEFENVVSNEQKKKRSKMLHGLSDEKRKIFYPQFIGKTKKILFEAYHNGYIQGHTDNYIKVAIKIDSGAYTNKVLLVKLEYVKKDFILGSLVK